MSSGRSLTLLALAVGCAKPLPEPRLPAFSELGAYATAARPYAGCWALRLSQPDPPALAELIVFELDTTMLTGGNVVESP